jgi:hypothetical protein
MGWTSETSLSPFRKQRRAFYSRRRENGMLSMDVEWMGGNGIPKIQLIDE